MICMHVKETHWINGFYSVGWDTKITTCEKCHKIFHMEKVFIPELYPSVGKDFFVKEAENLMNEIKDSGYNLDLMYEQIYKQLSFERAKKEYLSSKAVWINLEPTPSLVKYAYEMKSIGASWVSDVKKDISDFISSIGGWEIGYLNISENCKVAIKLV